MKKTLLTILSVCGFAGFVNAGEICISDDFCMPRWYVKGTGGVNLSAQPFDDEVGYYAGGAIGYKFTRFFRAEAEVAYRFNDVSFRNEDKDFHFHIDGRDEITAFVNGLVELPAIACFFPYLGLGLGYHHENYNIVEHVAFDRQDDAFAYQWIGGIGTRITPKMEILADYRVVLDTNAKLDDTFAISLVRFF